MKLLERILLAIDFGDLTDVTLDQAVHLAKRFDAEIVPLHAIEFLPYYSYEESISMVRKELQERMDQYVARLRDRGVRVHEAIVEVGAAWDVIQTAADTYDVNFILLGAGRKSLAERILAGSTLEKVVRRCKQPVWAMHPGDDRVETRSLVCATDFSPASDQAMHTASHLCRALDARLTVLHVNDSNSHYPHLPEIDVSVRRHTGDEAKAVRQPATERDLGEYLGKFDLDGIPVTIKVLHGDVDDMILKAIADEGCDLLVMGAVGHGGLMHRLLGNTTEKVLRKVTSSVLAVKYQDIFKVVHDAIELHESEITDRLQALTAAVEPHYQSGRMAASRGDAEAARDAYERCLEADPHFHPALEALADLCEEEGDTGQAAEYREKAAYERRYVWELQVMSDVRRHHAIDN